MSNYSPVRVRKYKDRVYLDKDHSWAKKLLFLKIRKFNDKAKKWNYDCVIRYDMTKKIVRLSKLIEFKVPKDGSVIDGYKCGYRNQYLFDLEQEILMEGTSLNYRSNFFRRVFDFIRFFINY